MNLYRVIVPIIILVIVVVVIGFVIVAVYRRIRNEEREREEKELYIEGNEFCHAVNPRTGWVCQNWGHHPGKHYQDINGERYDWIDD